MQLIACIVATTIVLIILKYVGINKLNLWLILTINYATCFLISGSFTISINREISILIPEFKHLVLGALFVLGYLFTQLALNYHSLQKTSLFHRLSLLLPIATAFIILHQEFKLIQVPGFLLAIAAMYFLTMRKKKSISFTIKSSTFILFLVWLVNGSIDSLFVLFSQGPLSMLAQMAFLAPIFLIAFLFSALVSFIKTTGIPSSREWSYGISLGIANIAGVFFFMGGLNSFTDDAIFITLNHCGIILLASLVGAIFFKEKAGRRMWVGTFLALIAIAWLVFTDY